MSKKVNGYIKMHETVLDSIRDLIDEKGETTPEVQQKIDTSLDELEGWYEYRRMFE